MLARNLRSKFTSVAKVPRQGVGGVRLLQTVSGDDLDTNSHIHFKKSQRPHPLNIKQNRDYDISLGDHTGRLQNHIWSPQEITEKMGTLYRHTPKSTMDHIMNKTMYGLYHTFNFITGYKAENPSVTAIQWRLIVLESIAGVPGFVAAGFRHFRSLRRIQRDHGWIATLLEEAENERMHLLLCINMFKATPLTRFIVVAGQWVMTPILMGIYLIQPKAMHRFVGYLEETACMTYVNTIKHVETPGTHLHAAWSETPAPAMGIGYYHLPHDAKWVDTLKCMMADEANHRDVNHTFAEMESDDPSPFVMVHKENAAIAWRLELTGEPAWVSPTAAVSVPVAPAVAEKSSGEVLKVFDTSTECVKAVKSECSGACKTGGKCNNMISASH